MEHKYEINNHNMLAQLGGSVIKYMSLMAGVYSMCKDEKDFALMAFSGIAYVCGDMMQVLSKKDQDKINLSRLEKTLKG